MPHPSLIEKTSAARHTVRHLSGSTLPAVAVVFSVLALVHGLFPAASAAVEGPAKYSVPFTSGARLDLYNHLFALVVGNSAYKHWPEKPGAVDRAVETGRILADSGFSGKLEKNLTADGFREVLAALARNEGGLEDRGLLLYYRGHTVTLKTEAGSIGYLVPSDCPRPGEGGGDFAAHALSLAELVDILSRARARHVLILVDGIVDDDSLGRPPSTLNDPTLYTAGAAVQLICAGRAGQQAGGEPSFLSEIERALTGAADANGDGLVTGSELAAFIGRAIHPRTGDALDPGYLCISPEPPGLGDFVFFPQGARPAPLTTPPAPELPATLTVASPVSGARVSLDGEALGETPMEGREVKPGEHLLSVRREGYETHEQALVLAPGQAARYTVVLERKGPEPAVLYMMTEPEDATVRIMTVKPSYQPGMELPPGTHRIRVSARGYETVEKLLDFEPGLTYRLPFALPEKGAATDKPAIPQNPASGKVHTNSLGMRFVHIPPGTFNMGSPAWEPERDSDERLHEVTITSGFHMQTTEVTQAVWTRVMGTNPSAFAGYDDCPVESVSHEQAAAFAEKLDAMESLGTYSLPTEAQWEYACRAGTSTPYFTGDCLSTHDANYKGTEPLRGCPEGEYRKRPMPVASFPPNPFGLHDMHGNVYEWCSDWLADYPVEPVADPEVTAKGSSRVYRGGAWSYYGKHCRSAERDGCHPAFTSSDLGFRLVWVP
ncbi:MAG: SUMF1/EgtB/PvdO family nonheme iron enzyme [Desulfatibacillaceae bacterium]